MVPSRNGTWGGGALGGYDLLCMHRGVNHDLVGGRGHCCINIVLNTYNVLNIVLGKQHYVQHKHRADSLQGVMAENADLLRERGEKLKQLQDRTTDMQNEASDFASMAKKLAENERKWF